jgi:hypothetical protein
MSEIEALQQIATLILVITHVVIITTTIIALARGWGAQALSPILLFAIFWWIVPLGIISFIICMVAIAYSIYMAAKGHKKKIENIPQAIPSLPVYPYQNQPNNQINPAIVQPPVNQAPPTGIIPATVVYRGSKLVLPDGNNIILAEATKYLGRSDFEKSVAPNAVSMISRQHFFIKYEDGKYFIDDYSSANGTKVNGIDIKGKGWQELKDGDKIDIANVAVVTFKN